MKITGKTNGVWVDGTRAGDYATLDTQSCGEVMLVAWEVRPRASTMSSFTDPAPAGAAVVPAPAAAGSVSGDLLKAVPALSALAVAIDQLADTRARSENG